MGDEQEQFVAFPENDFVESAKDRLSTFGLDVDTTSYTIMRRDVLAGRQPHPASVRVEEFVNYFDHAYEPPASPERPFSICLEAAPSPFDAEVTLLRVGIKGFEVPPSRRAPANVISSSTSRVRWATRSAAPSARTGLSL